MTKIKLLLVTEAMIGNGHTRIHWNHYYEGWPEVVVLITLSLAYPWAVWQYLKK